MERQGTLLQQERRICLTMQPIFHQEKVQTVAATLGCGG